MKKLFFLLLFLMGSVFTHSQNVDSLLQEIQKAEAFQQKYADIPGTNAQKLEALSSPGKIISLSMKEEIKEKNFWQYICPQVRKIMRIKQSIQWNERSQKFSVYTEDVEIIKNQEDINLLGFWILIQIVGVISTIWIYRMTTNVYAFPFIMNGVAAFITIYITPIFLVFYILSWIYGWNH